MLLSWWAFGVVVAAAGFGVWRLIRSTRRWKSPPPTAPDTRQAEARLWSTRIGDQH